MPDRQPVERLRQYLRELKSETRSLLIAELERGLLQGDEALGAELVLQELRRSAREATRPAPRVGNLARLFFQPLEPFLVDDVATHNHPGRIARVALDPVWQWVSRDLMPGEAKAVSDDVARAIALDDVPRAEELARAFQDRAAIRMQEALAAAESDDKARRKLAAQVTTPRPTEDVRAVCSVLRLRDALAAFADRIPSHIKILSDGPLETVWAQLESPAMREPHMFLYALLIVMSRLAAPWQLIRLATKAAGSDIAARVSETRYAVAVDIVLAEIERMIGELRTELKSGRGVGLSALLKSIHDAARGLHTELDLPAESPWARRLAHSRAEIADLLRGEIEAVPGRVRRLLRPRPASEIAPGARLDSQEVGETEALIEFLGTCRNYAGELAISEMTQRAWSEIDKYLDAGTQPLIDALRSAREAERDFRQSQFDAAVRFSAKLFGRDYADGLAKAGELARTAERKASA
jgi:hypothetical protein